MLASKKSPSRKPSPVPSATYVSTLRFRAFPLCSSLGNAKSLRKVFVACCKRLAFFLLDLSLPLARLHPWISCFRNERRRRGGLYQRILCSPTSLAGLIKTPFDSVRLVCQFYFVISFEPTSFQTIIELHSKSLMSFDEY